MSQFAVFHIQKGTNSTGGLDRHLDRVESSRENSFPTADPNLIHLNKEIDVGFRGKISERRAERIEKGYTKSRAIRKDAVKHLSIVLSGTHEQMINLQKENRLDDWVQKNQEWLQHEFGSENLIKLVLHLDEKTPHLHAVVVPLTEDGSLSAKKVMGGPAEMSDRQTRYAEAMSEFGLSRGLKGSKVKHENAQEYYKRINAANDLDNSPVNVFNAVSKAKELQGQVSALKTENSALERKFEAHRGNVEKAQESVKIRDKVFSLVQNNSIAELYRFVRELFLKGEEKKKTSEQVNRNEIQRDRNRNSKDRGRGM